MTRTLTRTASLTRRLACPTSTRRPTARIAGALGSVLRAGDDELTVCHCAGAVVDGAATCRTWTFDDLAAVRLARYGPLGVVEATIRATGANLPLLLLTPTQILPARRALPLIAELLGQHQPRKTA